MYPTWRRHNVDTKEQKEKVLKDLLHRVIDIITSPFIKPSPFGALISHDAQIQDLLSLNPQSDTTHGAYWILPLTLESLYSIPRLGTR